MRPSLIALCLIAIVACSAVQIGAQTKLPAEPLGANIKAVIEPPVTVEGGYPVMPPRPVRTPDPKIPKDSVKGMVLIKCVVGIDGMVHDAHVTQSLSPQNDASALEAVKHWKFLPTKRDGKPVAVRTSLAVRF